MGFKARQNHTGEKRSPLKITFLMFTVPVFLLFAYRFVLRVLIVNCRMFLIFGEIVCISNTFIN